MSAAKQRRREGARLLKTFRAAIQSGIDSLDRGDYVEIDSYQLAAYVKNLRRGRRKQ